MDEGAYISEMGLEDVRPFRYGFNGSNIAMEQPKGLLRDLTQSAREGNLIPAYGLDKQVFGLLQRLTRKDRQSVMIVGNRGVGKTTLINGMVTALANSSDEGFQMFTVMDFDIGAFIGLKEKAEAALSSLVRFLRSSPDHILVIDGASPLFSNSSDPSGYAGMMTLLEPLIRQREIVCLCTLTPVEFDEAAKTNPKLIEVFQKTSLEEASEEQALKILEQKRPLLEQHYDVEINKTAIRAAVKHTQEFMPDQALPGKAAEVLDQACARYSLKRHVKNSLPDVVDTATMQFLGNKVSEHDVKRVVMENTSINIDEVQAKQWKTNITTRMKRTIIGQDNALEQIADAAAEARTGFGARNRPLLSAEFSGIAGVGKSETAKLLTTQLFGSEEFYHHIDLSKFTTQEAVSVLFVESFRAKDDHASEATWSALHSGGFALYDFDGVEQVHPSFFDLLDIVLSTGSLRSERGKTFSFERCALILSQNTEHGEPRIPDPVRTKLDAVIPFEALDREIASAIFKQKIKTVYDTMRHQKFKLRLHEDAIAVLVAACFNGKGGLTGVDALLNESVIGPLTTLSNSGQLSAGMMVELNADGDSVQIVQRVE